MPEAIQEIKDLCTQIGNGITQLKTRLDATDRRVDELTARGDRPQYKDAKPPIEPMMPGEVRSLKNDQSMFDALGCKADHGLSLGRFIRGIVTGKWDGAESEVKAMSVGTPGAGGYLVPTPLSARIIDLARNKARIFQAGATTIPMEASTLKIARVTGDPTASWKVENAAGNFADMSFDSVTLVAKTLISLSTMSVELAEDGQGIDRVLENAMSEALALELDRSGLRGSGSGAEPRGLRNTTGVHVVELGTGDGGNINFTHFTDAVRLTMEANGPEAAELATIYAPRTWAQIDGFKAVDNQPLQPPKSYADLKKFVTNQVPIDLTVGVADTCSEVYVGNFPELLVGMRTNMVIEATRVAGDTFRNLQVAVRAYLRADISVARPTQFVIYTGAL